MFIYNFKALKYQYSLVNCSRNTIFTSTSKTTGFNNMKIGKVVAVLASIRPGALVKVKADGEGKLNSNYL